MRFADFRFQLVNRWLELFLITEFLHDANKVSNLQIVAISLAGCCGFILFVWFVVKIVGNSFSNKFVDQSLGGGLFCSFLACSRTFSWRELKNFSIIISYNS